MLEFLNSTKFFVKQTEILTKKDIQTIKKAKDKKLKRLQVSKNIQEKTKTVIW
jgi:hypothetical protein